MIDSVRTDLDVARSNLISYYENLILTEENAAYHLTLPINAEAFRPNNSILGTVYVCYLMFD